VGSAGYVLVRRSCALRTEHRACPVHPAQHSHKRERPKGAWRPPRAREIDATCGSDGRQVVHIAKYHRGTLRHGSSPPIADIDRSKIWINVEADQSTDLSRDASERGASAVMDLCSQWRPRENYSFRVGMQERRQLEIVLEAELVADAPTQINACKSRPRRCSGTSRHLPRSEEIEGDRPVFGPDAPGDGPSGIPPRSRCGRR